MAKHGSCVYDIPNVTYAHTTYISAMSFQMHLGGEEANSKCDLEVAALVVPILHQVFENQNKQSLVFGTSLEVASTLIIV